MDAHAAQLRHQMDETRAAIDAQLTQLEQRVSQMPAVLLEQHVLGPVRGVQATAAQATTWLYRYPWLILVGGALVGYQLHRAHRRPVRPVPPPPRAAVTPPREPPLARVSPTVYEAPRPPPTAMADPPASGEPTRAAPSDPRPSPWALGGLGATELGRRVLAEIRDDDCLGRAAQLAYYFLFALFPFFLFLTTLLGYLPIPDLLDRLLETLGQMLPGEALRLVEDNVRQLVTDRRGGLLSFGILAALWTSSSALTAITDSLNRAYDVEEGRPFWKVRLIAIGLTVGLSVFIVVALVLLTFGPQLGRWVADLVGLGGIFEVTWNVVRWPVIVGLLVVAIALLYYFAPDVEQAWTWITPGSACAVLAWLLASLGFAFYVNRFGSYNATYGSIGAVIVLLTWMYVTGLFILIGGEINAEIEHAAPSGKEPGEKQ
ncbi:MAG: ribonuclease [Geminicoccaceae bacterium]|nr:ribonuclease [Geminicoccaceae bacterium]